MNTPRPFQAPDPVAQQHSDRLANIIQQHIEQAGGEITFSDYMHLCLYAPELGYYSSGKEKIGQAGDFTTAPEVSSLFGQSLAQHITDVGNQFSEYDLLEFGAGNGKMAADILQKLSLNDALPRHYYIIEASAYLQVKQEGYLKEAIPEHYQRIRWLKTLPEHFQGVILANEVCDAMPISRLHFEAGTLSEGYVHYTNGEFSSILRPISEPTLLERAEHISQALPDAIDYVTEVNLQAEAWVASLADCVDSGAIFIIDYGYVEKAYYHPERNTGTLMCYYQHQGHDNPFILAGLQDITSHVDFTALAESAHAAGLDVTSFQTQADFLLAGDITQLLEHQTMEIDDFERLQHSTAVKRLILPSEMGEVFKVLSLTKNLPSLLPRLALGDRRYQL